MSTKAIQTHELQAAKPSLRLHAGARARTDAVSRLLGRPAFKAALFLCGDVAAVGIAHLISAHIVRQYLQVPEPYLNPPHYHVFYMPFLVLPLYLFGGYQSPELRRPEKDLAVIFKAISLSFAALVCASFVFFKTSGYSRYLMCAWYALCLLFLVCARLGFRAAYGALWRKGLAQRTALLVGSPQKLAEFQNVLSIQRYRGYRIVGVIPIPGEDPPSDPLASGLPVLGTLNDWEEIAARQGDIQLIVICPQATTQYSHGVIREMLQRCQARKIDVEVPSDLFASSGFNIELDEFSGLFRFYAAPRWSRQVQRLMKGVIDRLAGFVGSVITLILTIPIAFLIWLEDRGPVFYRSAYLGQDGSIRYYLKFRTMRVDADQILDRDAALRARFREKQKLVDDPRVTRIGCLLRKSSLDEFPQFFSVLKGDLTLVGPRTIRREETAHYGPLLEKLLSVKPGVTGFWQVTGRQTTSYAERIQMDMFYIEKWTIWLDVLIIAKTFWKVIRAEGAY